jgi:hypothetical protein
MKAAHVLGSAAMAVAVASCVGSTGNELVTFHAAAAGPSDAVAGSSLSFTTPRGFHVVLTQARVHVGAIYLNESVPISGSQATSCTLPGIYVGEVTEGLDVDALSPAPQPFPAQGRGTAAAAVAGEVWLTAGDVNAEDTSMAVVQVAGTAEKAGVSYPFEGRVTIGKNRVVAPKDPSMPGANPICRQRIISPIPTHMSLRPGSTLLLRIDPRGWFVNVDFGDLEKVSDAPLYRFADEPAGTASNSFYSGVRATSGVYAFEDATPP